MIRAALVLTLVVALAYAARSFLPGDATVIGSGSALAFGFLLLAAIQTGQIFHALKLPHLTGYLLCGAIMGPEIVGILTRPMVHDLALVKRVAVGLIALTAGCELNFRALRPRLRAIGSVSVASLVLAGLLLWAFLFLATPYLPFAAGMTVTQRAAVALVGANALAALSPAVVVGIISETRARGPLSELATSIVVVADLAIVITFSLSDAVARAVLPGSGSAAGAGALLFHIFGSIGVGVAIGAGLALFISRVGKRVALLVFGVFFVVAEAGGAIHVDPLLAGLAAGLFLENISPVDGHRVISEIEVAAVPTFALFFGVVGAEVHLHAFFAVAGYGVAAALLRALGLWMGARAGARLAGLEPDLARRLPLGLFPQAGVALALAALVDRQYAGWGPGLATLLLGTIVVNEMVGPILWRLALLRAGEVGARNEPEEAPHAARAATTGPLSLDRIKDEVVVPDHQR